MKNYKNITKYQSIWERDERYALKAIHSQRITEGFLKRLGLVGELDGHTGCVNCLEWSEDARFLASGSDDVHICIWDPFKTKKICSIPTGHHGNVFSVKFLPNTSNEKLVSGAADHCIRLHDAPNKECLRVCTCHSNRVKRLVTDVTQPYLFWSAGEDGLIIQHDTRIPHTCSPDVKNLKNVLINLRDYIGSKAEAKCLSLNPTRPELLAVGANDPFVRLYDRRMIKVQFQEQEDGTTSLDSPGITAGAVQYFVPGHLPSKTLDFVRKYRSLASTYVEFNPDGSELLVNLGGEQIYLFPLWKEHQRNYEVFSLSQESKKLESSSRSTNGYTNGYRKGIHSVGKSSGGAFATGAQLPYHVDKLKQEANAAFDSGKYSRAIQLYNEALELCPNSSVLLGNRAAALLKRSWDGDAYVALRDCCAALKLDSGHHKAFLRLCRCLYELSRYDEALSKHDEFKLQFPDFANSSVSKRLQDDIASAIKKQEAKNNKTSIGSESSEHSLFSTSTSSSDQSATSPNSSSTPIRLSRSIFFHFSSGSNDSTSTTSSTSTANQSTPSTTVNQSPGDLSNVFDESPASPNDSNVDSSQDEPNLQSATRRRTLSGIEQVDDTARDSPETARPAEKFPKRTPKYHTLETLFREEATDFSERYCGHCNTTTDIKEANFFGNYIIAGSDDGSFFIWDRKTTNIVRVLRGDESIVNCLQPHPTSCLLATSGIEQVVRLWAPLPEDGSANDRIIADWNDVASENQKRMNSNPFEVILMNMGYRINPDEDTSDEEGPQGRGVPCNQT